MGPPQRRQRWCVHKLLLSCRSRMFAKSQQLELFLRSADKVVFSLLRDFGFISYRIYFGLSSLSLAHTQDISIGVLDKKRDQKLASFACPIDSFYGGHRLSEFHAPEWFGYPRLSCGQSRKNPVPTRKNCRLFYDEPPVYHRATAQTDDELFRLHLSFESSAGLLLVAARAQRYWTAHVCACEHCQRGPGTPS